MNKDTPNRQRVWLDAWIAVATASNSTSTKVATDWADVCLREFDRRFPEKQETAIV